MNLEKVLTLEEIEIDLAFTGFVPDILEYQLDQETKNTLTDLTEWSSDLKRWIDFIRNKPELTCPEIIKTNNNFSLGLIFTDDLSITKINNKWRKQNIPTDVLSFPAIDPNFSLMTSQSIELGDIIISVETACKQAKLNAHSIVRELKWLVSHGFLHLLGWQHNNSSSLEKMLSVQNELITSTKLFSFQ